MSSGDDGAGFASVAVPVPVRRLFTYRVPPELTGTIETGSRVQVPFGGRKLLGTVVEWPAQPPDGAVELKTITSLLDDPPLSATLLELTRFVSDYYLCSWGDAIEAALPPRVQASKEKWVRRRSAANPSELGARETARRRLLAGLPEDGTAIPLNRLGVGERRSVAVLVDRGWVEVLERSAAPEVRRAPAAVEAEAPHEPTPGQAAVLATLEPAIDADRYAPYLLHGATGSGKTEIYLRAARRALDRGRGCLYLVPEIGLTPLLRELVSRRFPGQAVVLHSGLPKAARARAWEAVRSGRCRFVVGTRSAVFAPMEEIGLIVVDEEQDGSYKQEETPRYNGRDLAVLRAKNSGAVVLLGSATPSMESFQHARSGRYGLLRLGGRVKERPLPDVLRVDMREEYQQAGKVAPLSGVLIDALKECLGRGEQALILRNRRGWSAALLCPRCGNRLVCPRCSISLTWHRAERRLRCHACHHNQSLVESCPTCGCDDLHAVGEGTERLEDLVRVEIPEARVERMDRDTIRRRGAHEEMLTRFRDGKIDILVGTQMIAKGHDFPRVTLVGVLSADQSLGLPDFRASERTFQLLTQVAGRAGRGERPGRVVVQAFEADHPVLALAAAQDYEAFFEREIVYRRALRYPPLSAMVQLRVIDPDLLRAREWAEELGRALHEAGGGRLLISGPGPAPIERLKGRYRQQILARSAGRRRLVEAVDRALTAIADRVPRRALQVDVDPVSLL